MRLKVGPQGGMHEFDNLEEFLQSAVSAGSLLSTLFPNIQSPQRYNGQSSLTSDQSIAVNSMTAAARATYNSTYKLYQAYMNGWGGQFLLSSPADFSMFRSAYGMKAENFTFLSAVPTTAVDAIGARYTQWDNIVIVGAGNVGMSFQRFDNGSGSGPAAGSHRADGVYIDGTFDLTCLRLYGVEESRFKSLVCFNAKRDVNAYGVICEGYDDHPVASTVAGVAAVTGARSFINTEFDSLKIYRLATPTFSITAISKANPGVATYSVNVGGIAPVNGDFLCIAAPTGMTQLDDILVKVNNLDTTAHTFELQDEFGVNIDTSAYSTFDAADVFYRTGPGLYVSRSIRVKFIGLYAAVYGANHVVLGCPDGFGIEGLEVDMHGEGTAVKAQFLINCGTRVFSLREFKWRDHAGNQAKVNHMQISASGPGKVQFFSPDWLVQRYHVNKTGKFFDHPELVEIYGGKCELNEGLHWGHAPADFAFIGGGFELIRRDGLGGPYKQVFGEVDRKWENEIDDHFLGPALNTANWTKLLGTDGACAAAPITAVNFGALGLTGGADAGGTMALNGAQIVGNTIWAANNGGYTMDFALNFSGFVNVVGFAGLTDILTLNMPATLGALDAITSATNDYCGVLADTAAATGQFFFVARKAGGTEQKIATGVVPSTGSTYARFRLEVDVTGAASLYKWDGAGVWSLVATFAAAIKTTNVAPSASVFSRAAVSRIMRLDQLRIRQRAY